MSISPARKAKIRLQAQETAARYRRELGLGIEPIADVFDLMERQGILVLRYPSPSNKVSAFITPVDGTVVVYINSAMTLGRQVFSAAHELGHFCADRENLAATICDPGRYSDEDPSEYAADCLAGAFLMPSDGVRKVFHERFGMGSEVGIREVVILQHTFQVSYAAMIVALHSADLISHTTARKLREYGSPENAELLRSWVLRLGYTGALISPTKPVAPSTFIQALNANYDNGRISFRKLSSLLALWETTPEEMGFRIV